MALCYQNYAAVIFLPSPHGIMVKSALQAEETLQGNVSFDNTQKVRLIAFNFASSPQFPNFGA